MALSIVGFTAEQSHILAGGGSPRERMEAFVAGDRHVGMANTTQRWFVIDCRNSIIHAFTNPVADGVREAVSRRCLDGALAITETAPISSFAWFGAAHASLALQDWDGMNLYLERSHATGAQEGWIARYRAELAADNYSRISEANQALFREDLTLLAQNMFAFSEFLAGQYVSKVALRPMLTEIVETMPQASQWRFLALVRRLSTPSTQVPS